MLFLECVLILSLLCVAENNDLSRDLEDVQSKLNQVTKLKASLTLQIDDLKRQVDEENKVQVTTNTNTSCDFLVLRPLVNCLVSLSPPLQGRNAAVVGLANARHDLSLLKEQLEEESEGRGELQRLVSKLNADVTSWRSKYETDAIHRTEELEETKWVEQKETNMVDIVKILFNLIPRLHLLLLLSLSTHSPSGVNLQSVSKRLRKQRRRPKPELPAWIRSSRGCRERWRTSP